MGYRNAVGVAAAVIAAGVAALAGTAQAGTAQAGTAQAVSAHPASAAGTCRAWTGSHPPYAIWLTGVDALSPCDVWATGVPGVNTQSATVTDLLHWNGVRWTLHTSARVPAALLRPAAVSATSDRNVWLAGTAHDSAGNAEQLTAHWNGTALTPVSSPNPSTPPGVSLLTGVSTAGTDDAWAAGFYSVFDTATDTSQTYPLALRWQGHGWARVPAAIPAATPGTPSPFAEFNAVSTRCACDAWAVGNYSLLISPERGYRQAPLAEHWNGSRWQVTPAAIIGQWDNLWAVSAAGPDDVWAVGQFGDPSKTLTEHWNGRSWALVPSPSPGLVDGKPGGVLLGVAVVSARDAWAVGYYTVSPSIKQRALVLHWNGSAWRQVAIPHVGPKGLPNVLQAVSASSAGNVLAAGYYSSSVGQQSLLLRLG